MTIAQAAGRAVDLAWKVPLATALCMGAAGAYVWLLMPSSERAESWLVDSVAWLRRRRGA